MEEQETGQVGEGMRRGWRYTPQLLLFLLLLAVGGGWFWWANSGDWVVKVNGVRVSEAALQAETGRALQAFSRMYGIDLQSKGAVQLQGKIKEQVLNQMINQVLLKQAAYRAGIRVSTAEVDARVAEDAGRAGGADRLQQILKEQGLTLESYRNRIRDDLLIQKLGDQVTRDVQVSEPEIRAAYAQKFAGKVSYTEVREPLRQYLLANKKNQVFTSYLQRLHEGGRFMFRTRA